NLRPPITYIDAQIICGSIVQLRLSCAASSDREITIATCDSTPHVKASEAVDVAGAQRAVGACRPRRAVGDPAGLDHRAAVGAGEDRRSVVVGERVGGGGGGAGGGIAR